MTDPPPTTDNGYRYSPLPGPRAIRLIMLHASVTEDAPLCCEIVETALEEPGEYSALSYTWGGESPSLPMTVMPENNHNGGDDSGPSQVMLLTPNCAAALRILRKRIGGTGRGIWVDAVCINQADHSEKNGQVGMMADIYQRAGDVVVWLGGDFAPRDTRTMKFLAMGWLKWVREVKPEGHFLKHRLVSPFWGWFRQWPCRAAVRVCGSDGHAPLAVSQAPYWNRAWTVQEAAHANAVLVCRDSGVVELRDVFDAVWTFCEGRRVPGFNFVMHQNLYEGARRLAGDERFAVWGFGRWDVRNVAAKGASDPRDRVFALRSVYPEFGMVDVDYGRDVGGVFAEATRRMVEKNMEVLFEAESPSETELVDGIPASVVRLINYVATENTFHVSRRTLALLQSRLENKDGTRDIRRIVSDDVVSALPTACYEGSRMFLTTEGRFGWAHARLEPGDLICAFAGLMYPMAVRPKGPSYVVVGPAVPDGVMSGERWPAEGGDLEEWEIV